MNCIFCEFVAGKRKKHLNGYPFVILNKTRNTLAFLSTEFPAKEDGHIIVIPNKHFDKIESLPHNILYELIDHVVLWIKVFRETHEGCNILLNDGKSAGQYIYHAHFHVIPRDKGDNIKIESWKRKKISIHDFKKLNNRIKLILKRYK